MKPARILVIDDSELDILLLREALDQNREDYELETLSDGAQALRFVHEHRSGVREPEPCVIVLDLYLPLHDGITVLRALNQAPTLDHIKVVVLSGWANPHQEVEIASLGALYRKKPLALPELVKLAGEILALCKNSPIAKTV